MRYMRKRGGFDPTLASAGILGLHKTAQMVRPVTQISNMAKAFGLTGAKLNKNKFGRAVNKAGNFLKNKLGYGLRNIKLAKVSARRRGRPLRRRVPLRIVL